eukprot:GHVQ01027602.1.p1 GENE.GHVQ01027602.1~~GHVQ01027602.1.p1  ORF type:complete len:370 (+),score=77.84 GHVQ01027602.1:1280-2389(+)
MKTKQVSEDRMTDMTDTKELMVVDGMKEMAFGDWDNVQVRHLDTDNIAHLFYIDQNVLVKSHKPHSVVVDKLYVGQSTVGGIIEEGGARGHAGSGEAVPPDGVSCYFRHLTKDRETRVVMKESINMNASSHSIDKHRLGNDRLCKEDDDTVVTKCGTNKSSIKDTTSNTLNPPGRVSFDESMMVSSMHLSKSNDLSILFSPPINYSSRTSSSSSSSYSSKSSCSFTSTSSTSASSSSYSSYSSTSSSSSSDTNYLHIPSENFLEVIVRLRSTLLALNCHPAIAQTSSSSSSSSSRDHHDHKDNNNSNQNNHSKRKRVAIYGHSMSGAAVSILLGHGKCDESGYLAFDGPYIMPNAIPTLLPPVLPPTKL